MMITVRLSGPISQFIRLWIINYGEVRQRSPVRAFVLQRCSMLRKTRALPMGLRKAP